MTEFLRVKQWLYDTWKIVSPEEWLSACLEWIKEEQQQEGRSGSFENVCNQVFDQWLLSDLREIGATSFPPGLDRCQKTFLPGIYAAQVNSMVDISRPMYQQIQKLTGTENENALVDTATQQSQRPQEEWREKSNRMMMMMLTDGSQDVMAIECNNIPTIGPGLTLGTKVIIHGGVLCRMGLLMLKAENLSVLGGEVEGLVERLTQVKMAEEKLQSNIERHMQQEGQTGTQRYELPRREFPNYTVLSNSDFRTSGKQPKGHQDRSHQSQNSRGPKSEPRNPFKSEPRSSFKSEPSRSQGVATLVGLPRVKIENPTPTGSSGMDDPFGDDSSDLIFEEAMRRNLDPAIGPKVRNDLDVFGSDDDDLIFGANPVANGQPTAAGTSDDLDDELMAEAAMEVDGPEPANRDPKMTSSLYVDKSEDGRKRLKLSTRPEPTAVAKPVSSSVDRAALRPFTYIRHVLRENRCGVYFVKAYVSTISGKLESNEGRNWSLAARVDDGSATLDITLHDRILTKLLGFSSADCNDMKRRFKTEGHLKQLILGAIKQCQESLIKMSVIFELHVVPSVSSTLSSRSTSTAPTATTTTTTASTTAADPQLPVPNKDYDYFIMDYRKVTMDDVEAMKRVVSSFSAS